MAWLATLLTTLSLLQPSIAITSEDCNGNAITGRLPSLYEQYCCVDVNNRKPFVLKGEERMYFFCPSTSPKSCASVNFLASCSEILSTYPIATSGYYNLATNENTIATVYCDMDLNCNGERGWMRVGYLNMTDPNEQCPPGFRLYEENGVRACGRYTSGCLSVTYPSHDISYSQVCGRVIGYQQGTPDAIFHKDNGLNGAYVDGVSITRGNPRQHIWTYMASLMEDEFYDDGKEECPCAPNSPVTTPSFIGNDYFCESGSPGPFDYDTFYTADPLWDGEQCGLIEEECCNAPGIPWFHKPLQQPTTDYIELRVCGHAKITNEDAPVNLIEIHTK